MKACSLANFINCKRKCQIKENRNTQHRQNKIKSNNLTKRSYFGCSFFLLANMSNVLLGRDSDALRQDENRLGKQLVNKLSDCCFGSCF
jgi:hypothetical protein